MTFSESIRTCFSKYATFSGRATRSEFWWFALFCVLLSLPLAFLGPLAPLLLIPLWIPAISVEVRRLHDTGRSGWWFWIVLIPIVGLIKLVWYCNRGTVGDNRFGPDPLAVPSIGPISPSASSTIGMTERAEQLTKLKALLDAGTINQEEFDRMKGEVLAS